MANRWSNPSGSIGVNRFRVWPNKATDSFSTADLVANFDKIDGMFGVPSAGTAWPPDEGVDGGVYKQIALLRGELGNINFPTPIPTPLGMINPWWRPSGLIPIPAGWVEVAGQTLTSNQHGFPGGGSITLPDLRNKHIVGADSTKPASTAWLLPGNVNVNNAAGAPGLNFVGGSAQTTITIATMPSHDHGGGGGHTHTIVDNGHTHNATDPGHSHSINDPGHSHALNDAGHNHGGGTTTSTAGIHDHNGSTGGPSVGCQEVNGGHEKCGVYEPPPDANLSFFPWGLNLPTGYHNHHINVDGAHVHSYTVPTDTSHVSINQGMTGITGGIGQASISIQQTTTGVSLLPASSSVTAQGGGQPLDTRPASVGLIFIMKVF